MGVIAEVISAYALVTKSQNLLMAFSKLDDFIQIPDCEDNTSTSKSVLINAMNEEKSEHGKQVTGLLVRRREQRLVLRADLKDILKIHEKRNSGRTEIR